ncbi:MAG: hypothetical protein U0T81_10320 [Saprospiraceae bacterium]
MNQKKLEKNVILDSNTYSEKAIALDHDIKIKSALLVELENSTLSTQSEKQDPANKSIYSTTKSEYKKNKS